MSCLWFPLSHYKSFLSDSPPKGSSKTPISCGFFLDIQLRFSYSGASYKRVLIKFLSKSVRNTDEKDGGAPKVHGFRGV
jgi:hypothetical protein